MGRIWPCTFEPEPRSRSVSLFASAMGLSSLEAGTTGGLGTDHSACKLEAARTRPERRALQLFFRGVTASRCDWTWSVRPCTASALGRFDTPQSRARSPRSLHAPLTHQTRSRRIDTRRDFFGG